METWRVNAVNTSAIFALIYGSERLEARVIAIGKLRQLRIESPRRFTLSFIRDSWVAVNYRRNQELRGLTNILRLHAKVERPTFEQLKLIGMAILQSTGEMAYRRPNAFYIDGHRGYFQAELVKK